MSQDSDEKIERLVELSQEFEQAQGEESKRYIVEQMNNLATDLNPEEEYQLMVALLCQSTGQSPEETDRIIREEFGDDLQGRIAAVAELVHEVDAMVEILEMQEDDLDDEALPAATEQPRLLN